MPDSLRAVSWSGGLDGQLELIDQTRLPEELVSLHLGELADVIAAIRRLSVRGAPAIGMAAAYGLLLGVRGSARDEAELLAAVDARAAELIAARPTAVNLAWAVQRLRRRAHEQAGSGPQAILATLFEEARAIQQEDEGMSRAMAANGAPLISDGDGVLTHCNTGALAASPPGTALGVVIHAYEQGRALQVFVDETRPLLQGARLTAWELQHAGVPATLICDNTAAQVMREGRVQKVFVGADRIARNGDAANKVGTYGVAVLARAHGVPFYVVAPSSTFDLSIADGDAISIELRSPEEVTNGFGRRTAPEGFPVYSPAFDVTPADLIAGIVTERGVISPVNEAEIVRLLGEARAPGH